MSNPYTEPTWGLQKHTFRDGGHWICCHYHPEWDLWFAVVEGTCFECKEPVPQRMLVARALFAMGDKDVAPSR
jgi:hypothetical protein